MPPPSKPKMGQIASLKKAVRLGCRVGSPDPQAKRLRSYLKAALPTPPAAVNYSNAAAAALATMLGNDTLGDCVPAAILHGVGVYTANAGAALIPNNDEAIALYSEMGGYVPGDPATDQGCDWQTSLQDWISDGAPIGATKPAGYLVVDPTNLAECQLASWLFEALYCGANIPDAWLNINGNGFTWGPGQADPDNGHAFPLAGYNAKGFVVSTWGMIGTLLNAALSQNVQELYVVLSSDVVARAAAKAPNGLDWAALVADFDQLGGNVPAPGPAPSPTPTPTPIPTPVTGQGVMTLQTSTPAGSYLLVPMPSSSAAAKLTPSQWIQLVQEILAVVAGMLTRPASTDRFVRKT